MRCQTGYRHLPGPHVATTVQMLYIVQAYARMCTGALVQHVFHHQVQGHLWPCICSDLHGTCPDAYDVNNLMIAV